MSKISVDVSSARIPVLQVGYQGENEVTDVLFDISSWITEFGEGVAQLRVKRPGNSEEESYVLSLTITDGKAVWTVSDTDTANKGNGKVQLSYMVGNIVKKAVIYPYKVGKSIVGADNPVDPFDSWIERSKAWAIGETLDGDNVPETDETYQNNAKYYAEQADILGSAQVVLAAEKVTLAAEQVTLATEKADAAAASEAAVNGVSTQLTTRMSAIETEQAVQDARMDTFTSLPEGSTSGNAELADIRVGADGTTYDTAGNAVRGQISELKSDLNDIACVKYSTYNRQSEMFTLYGSNGYINNDTGQFVENELFRCYTFTNNRNAKAWFDTQQTWGQIAIYNGDIFVQSNLIFIGSLSRNTLPYIDNKLVIQSGMNVVICIRNDVDFTLNYPEGYYINEKQISLIANELLKPKIKIIPVTDTEFKVAVLNEKTGTYLYHIFKYEYYKDTVVGSSVWYSTFIQDEDGNNIMQGNTNFIHYLNEEGHTGHVGASHGCCVAVFDEFWADGKRFEPSALNEIIYCDTFRFTEKVKHYLIDTSNTTSSTHAMPYLDENGNPIVESIEYLDGCWEVNNKIVIRNRLDIKRNNTTFLQCHAGMCCGFYPYFDNIVVNNKEYVWNKIESSDGINFTIANMSGSDRLFNLGGSSAVTGDEVILFGEKYRVKNRIIQNDGTRYKNSNMLIQMPPYADNRIKTYLMPCVCSQSWESVSSGQTVETFNDGDILDTTIIREIDVSN